MQALLFISHLNDLVLLLLSKVIQICFYFLNVNLNSFDLEMGNCMIPHSKCKHKHLS